MPDTQAFVPSMEPMPEPDLDAVERRVGVTFKDRMLLRQALVHKSYTNDLGLSGLESNERLEYLGDAVLGALVAEQLYRRFPDRHEGQLTQLRSLLVRASTLAGWARQLELAQFVLVSRGEDRAGGRSRDPLLSSAFEAILGAIYLDRGFRVAQAFVKRFVVPEIERIADRPMLDAKSRLQMASQARFGVTPTYEVLEVSGLGHSPIFTVRVRAGGDVEATAQALGKQAAQQAAASEALERLEALPPPADQSGADDRATVAADAVGDGA
ncbi:MAG: ribonuclease III [Chloroflexota bacterium]|nr:ribonuclease III [Chloroflexota bacterium]